MSQFWRSHTTLNESDGPASFLICDRDKHIQLVSWHWGEDAIELRNSAGEEVMRSDVWLWAPIPEPAP